MSAYAHDRASSMGAVLAFPKHAIRDEEQPAYDGRRRRPPVTPVRRDAVDRARPLGLAAMGLYLDLERRCNGAGVCWPSYQTLADECGASRRHVIGLVKRLAGAGLVQVRPRREACGDAASNEFYLPLHPALGGATDALPSERGGEPDAPGSERGGEPPRARARHGSEVVRSSGSPPLPPATETAPWPLFEALCVETGADPATAARGFKNQQLGIAKRLAADGYGADDVRGCVAYLRSESWRTGLIDLRTVVSQIGAWVMAGRPAAAAASANGQRPTSKAGMTATAYAYFKEGGREE